MPILKFDTKLNVTQVELEKFLKAFLNTTSVSYESQIPPNKEGEKIIKIDGVSQEKINELLHIILNNKIEDHIPKQKPVESDESTIKQVQDLVGNILLPIVSQSKTIENKISVTLKETESKVKEVMQAIEKKNDNEIQNVYTKIDEIQNKQIHDLNQSIHNLSIQVANEMNVINIKVVSLTETMTMLREKLNKFVESLKKATITLE